MKKSGIVEKKDLLKWLESLSNRFDVIAPVDRDGDACFEKTTDFSAMVLDFSNTKEPPKKLFFPQCETLFSFDSKGERSAPDPADERPRIVFGMRPCDVRALCLLDNVFDDDTFRDPYYMARRENTIVVALACVEPRRDCFCLSFGLGPHDREGSDIFTVDLGGKFYVEAVTDRGMSLLDELTGLKPLDRNDETSLEELKSRAESAVRRSMELEGVAGKLSDAFDDSIWDELQERCIRCGVCSFLCPTCHCFDISDERAGSGGRRIRTWDCCMFDNFTKEASGHNPRPTGKERLRQRVMHKFDYFVKNYGVAACVGCGRCIRNCPGGMDIVSVMKRLKELKDRKDD